jgi:excisionase family DNA binding protein
MEEVYTLEEVPDRLKMSLSTVRRLVREGEIKVSRVGRQLRVIESALTEFLRRQQEENRPPFGYQPGNWELEAGATGGGMSRRRKIVTLVFCELILPLVVTGAVAALLIIFGEIDGAWAALGAMLVYFMAMRIWDWVHGK